MKWADWEATYDTILNDMSLNRELEARALEAAVRASSVTRCLKDDAALAELRRRIGHSCIVCGNSPGLEHDMGILLECGAVQGNTIIAADAAGPRIGRIGVVPDIIVTDMDGETEDEIGQNARGTLLLLHFHGDNAERASEISMRLGGPFIITVQSMPGKGVFNFGGFTDGDRAVLLAEEFGIRSVVLAGFDFLSPYEQGREREIKLRKLRWAKSIMKGASERGVTLLSASESVSLMETNKKVNV